MVLWISNLLNSLCSVDMFLPQVALCTHRNANFYTYYCGSARAFINELPLICVTTNFISNLLIIQNRSAECHYRDTHFSSPQWRMLINSYSLFTSPLPNMVNWFVEIDLRSMGYPILGYSYYPSQCRKVLMSVQEVVFGTCEGYKKCF